MGSHSQLEGQRITLKRNRPNPLFEDWLEELYGEAKAKKSKLELKLKMAYESLSKYPLPLETGMDCAMLKGFDKKLCSFLDRRLEVYNSQHDDLEPSTSKSPQNMKPAQSQSNTENIIAKKAVMSEPSKTITNSELENNKTKDLENTHKSNRKYKPVFRSGSYAILIALLEQLRDNPNNPSLSKDELIEKAQPHSEESFTRPKPESFYTAWSNMSRLTSKGLVKQVRSKKTYYSLTDEGIALATELLCDSKSTPTINDIIFDEISSASPQNQDDFSNEITSTNSQNTPVSLLSQKTVSDKKVVEFPVGSFDVILLIDKNETGGVNNKKDPTVVQFNKYPDLKHEYRSLKVGDFTWIARHKVHNDQELVLPYVAERKRMDDLGHSIKDGRFHEQKFRLRKCGLANVIYLVENFGSNKHVGLPIQSLMQALANTRVQDGFKIQITDSLSHTARFLAMMTKRLTVEYKDKCLIGSNSDPQGEELMIFSYFNKSSTKNKPLTVTETFIKLLLQLKGVSVEKALAVTKEYSTPTSLITQYNKCTQKEGETLLAHLKYDNQGRNVGPTISKSIYKFFVWKE